MMHEMVTESESDLGWQAQCPDCPRRYFAFREGGPRDIQDRGDFSVAHTWTNIGGLWTMWLELPA